LLSLLDKLKTRRNTVLGAALAAILILAGAIAIFILKLNARISNENDRQRNSVRVEVQEKRLTAPSRDGLTIYLDSSDVRAVSSFAGSNYLATSGGLLVLDDADNVKLRYTTLDGLPDNDLTALAVFRDRLFIGTAAEGLIGFDGAGFTAYAFKKPKANHVSALASTESELLIGTLDNGLLEYDGERFTRRIQSTEAADFSRVTALLPFESRVYIGTQDKGLFIWREARIEHIDSHSLPSPHVTGLAVNPPSLAQTGAIAVATDFGIVALNDANEIRPLSNRPNATSLAVSAGRLWAGFFGGGASEISAERVPEAQQARQAQVGSEIDRALAETPGLPRATPTRLFAGKGRLWALTTEGAFTRDEYASGPAFDPVAVPLAAERVLTAGHITSLAFDGSHRLWVGYFDRGIDLISTDAGERLSHVEDDRVREVNFILSDASEDRMLAATSKGLVSFDGRMKQAILTREKNGLINDSVAHVTFVEASVSASDSPGPAPVRFDPRRVLVAATPGGLTEFAGGRARSLTAFHGLASNHLYTTAAAGSRLFVGSLAGLVELEGLRVVRTYKTSNSSLSHDWVTALADAGGTLYVGTNGGGVDALLPSGEWINFADELGKFEVNQNSMHFDGERLYVGTSDRGLLIYNTRGRRWTRISAGLASQSITAITTDDLYVYAGTSNGLVRIEKRIIE
jgi:ligand-binding sensor domain-containing protein